MKDSHVESAELPSVALLLQCSNLKPFCQEWDAFVDCTQSLQNPSTWPDPFLIPLSICMADGSNSRRQLRSFCVQNPKCYDSTGLFFFFTGGCSLGNRFIKVTSGTCHKVLQYITGMFLFGVPASHVLSKDTSFNSPHSHSSLHFPFSNCTQLYIATKHNHSLVGRVKGCSS